MWIRLSDTLPLQLDRMRLIDINMEMVRFGPGEKGSSQCFAKLLAATKVSHPASHEEVASFSCTASNNFALQ